MLHRLVRAVEAARYRHLNRRERDIRFRGGLVSFTFDDFPESAREGAERLQARGWRGTFYMASALVGQNTRVGTIAGFQTARQLRAAGHEIGNHTHTHLRCKGVKKSVLRRDVQASIGALASIDGNRSFALPYGAHDPSALNVLSGRFDTIRTVERGVNARRTDLNALKANPIYRDTSSDKVQALLDETFASDGWLIFYTHDVRGDPSEFGCTPEHFEEVLALVARRGLAVRTISQAYGSL